MTNCETEPVGKARAQVNKMRQRIRAAVEAGRHYDAKSLARKLFLSHAAKVLACHEALASWPPYERGRLPSLDTLVSRIDDFDNDDQRVRVIQQPKGGGRFRDTFDYSVLDRARQRWVKLSFEPLACFHVNQSGVTGSGPSALMDRIRSIVTSGEYRYAAEFDIKNCFQSIQNMEALRAEWNLPNWAIQQIVTLKGKEDKGLITDRKGRALTGSSSSTGTLTTRGLPQGASTSPLFAYSLNRPVLEALESAHGHEAVVFNHCDNFLVLGISREAVERTHQTLTTLLSEHPVGPLALHIKTAPTPLGRGITFLGYRIRKSSGAPVISIDRERKEHFFEAVRAKLHHAKVASISRQALYLVDVQHYVEGWVSAYSAASNDIVEVVRTLDRIFVTWRNRAPICSAMHRLASKLPPQDALEQNVLLGPARTRVRARITGTLTDDVMQVPRNYSIRQTQQSLRSRGATGRRTGEGSPRRLPTSKDGLGGGLLTIPAGFSIRRLKQLLEATKGGAPA
ncbi:reverse transcriptase domain-containing protein [Bosea sp. CS1GBMeth4]|uniref:reverse transcriptase domain-containing protein n=1 Tax=Bosea sp. CS1GBMeth4 TaxID=1892849 RepID=UPI0016441E0E|nr:reverse transcriptase domain-containing protein [Bosea sp. CS1GBMeth4]